MKTLFDKLKPQFKDRIISQSELYPNTFEKVFTELKCKYYWTDLTVGNAFVICNYLNLIMTIDVLDNLFEK